MECKFIVSTLISDAQFAAFSIVSRDINYQTQEIRQGERELLDPPITEITFVD